MLLSRRHFNALPLAAFAGSALPKRQWTVYIIQHSHTDIGFTERQEVVADYHAQFVRQALQLSRSPKQAQREENCRFRYTFEGFWQVEQFLSKATPAERQALVAAMRSGSLELTGLYFNILDLADQELLRRSIKFASDFARHVNVPLTVAMGSDVNGLSWGMADALAEQGVLRLSMNINPDQGGYPFGKPLVPFYWEAPSGRRLLVWNGLAYHKANLFGLMGGSVPAGDPGIPGLILPGVKGYVTVSDTSIAEQKLLPFLAWLEESGYPYDFLPLMGSGTYTDNSPPGDTYCDIIQQWNGKFGQQVSIKSSTLNGFFDRLEQQASGLPVYRGEWTDWWSDTPASAPNDTAIYRNALRTRRLITRLDPKAEVVAPPELDAIDRKLLLYCEHTFGYSKTFTPSLLGEQVFQRKSKHATDADELSSAALLRLLPARGAGPFTSSQPFTYTAVNAGAKPVQSLVGLPVNFWEAPVVERGIQVVDEQGQPLPSQIEQSPRGWNVFILTTLNAGASRRYRLVPAQREQAPASNGDSQSFENSFYRLNWKPTQGIVSFVDRGTGAELLSTQQNSLGCPVYQLFPGADRSQAGAVNGPRTRPSDTVTFGQCKSVRQVAGGPLFNAWEFQYAVPGVVDYRLELRCFHDLPHFDLTARLVKTEVDDPEGLYIYFPLSLADARWYLDKPSRAIRPGIDQLPGTCCDHYAVQHGAALVGPQGGIAFATLDAPLVQLGELRLWRFTTTSDGKGPLYSWITNNKWQTNCRIRTGGGYELRYRLTAGTALRDSAAAIEQCAQLSQAPLVMRS